MRDKILVAVDTETTGLQPGFHQLVEIGAVKFRGDEILDEFQSLINPERDIPEEVINIHGITSDMVADAPYASEVVPKFIEFAEDAPLLAHNAPFDESFLSFNLQNRNSGHPDNEFFDTLIMTRKLFPELRSHSLANLGIYLEISDIPAHRAVADVMTTIGIFRECVRKLEGKGIKTWDDFLDYYGHPHRFNFEKYDISKHLPEEFQVLRTVIEQGDKLLIDYIANNANQTRRLIVPESIFKRDENFYLNAYCHLRCENRLFRLDRVVKFEPVDKAVSVESIEMDG